ncbi:MAG: hypothetical protein PVF63_04055 [Gammaproteobacteria bacterium]|jgi:hypothetical protein
MRRRDAICTFLAVGLTAIGVVRAQTAESFTARLDWVPISGSERNDVAGNGIAIAKLSRLRLSITGTFEGMVAPATRVSLHHGVDTGVRGPEIAELEITKGRGGTFEGEVTLTRDQREALLAGRVYLRLDGERGVPPENAVLWGWFFSDSFAAQ